MVDLFRRGILTLLVSAVVAACASTSSSNDKTAESSSAALQESTLRISSTQYLGKITNGNTRQSRYTATPSYQSYGFEAKGGDQITASVSAADGGDAMAWITDNDLHILAANDDAHPGTHDAEVTYRVPFGLASQSYRLVYREYQYAPRQFTTNLSIDVAAGVCSFNGQTYNPGDSFESVDGCNSCSCDSEGAVSCGNRVCDCNPANEPWHTYYGTPSQCIQLLYNCPSGEHTFANTCGCGCERPH